MRVSPDNELLQYSGRIDFDNPMEPVFVYPCSYIKMNFTGTSLKVVVENHHNYWDNYLGYFIDGSQEVVELPESGKVTLTLADHMENKQHELMLFKRMDSCHTFTFYGFEVDDDAVLSPVESKPYRRIEVFGDSVSAGEVSEAIDYVGQADPEHHGQYSNSWYSYTWMTARKLGAEIHDVAQGGIPLLTGTGWFSDPHFIGMEDVYDKIEYNPDLGEAKEWDFKNYTPHVVIVGIGQNDNHPDDYMAADYNCEKAVHWRAEYKKFIEKLHDIYPKAQIICATTILRHDASWDQAIDDVCKELQKQCGNQANAWVHHFLYTNNGDGTDGHIRIPEAEKMSDELTTFIQSLGDEIWV